MTETQVQPQTETETAGRKKATTITVDSKMQLINSKDFPPGGWQYREPSLNWSTTQEMAMAGLGAVAAALQMVRAQNPASGLNSSYKACLEAVKKYTCHRLNYDPRWCGLPPSEIQTRSALRQAGQKSRKVQGCASCGKRRR